MDDAAWERGWEFPGRATELVVPRACRRPRMLFVLAVLGVVTGCAEVSPETLWREEGGRIVANGFHALFREIRARSGKPFVAHGLAFSLGTPIEGGACRDRISSVVFFR